LYDFEVLKDAKMEPKRSQNGTKIASKTDVKNNKFIDAKHIKKVMNSNPYLHQKC